MVASIIVISQRSIADAVIYVYVPVLLLVPGLYSLLVPHLPPLSFAICAILPIGIALLFVYGSEWRPQRADLWLLLFIGGLVYTEHNHTNFGNAELLLFESLTGAVFPYAIGKLLLEKEGMRERFVRQFVFLLFIVSVLSVTEFRLGLNLFTTIAGKFFPGQNPWTMQVRGGFVRVAGPFTGSILGGMILLVGMLFGMWLGFFDKSNGTDRKYFKVSRATILTLGILAGLYMTNSRGPWLGAVLGFLVARIGRAKNIRRTAIITFVLCAIGGTVGYIKAEEYTAGTIWDAKDVEQEDAIYRRQLLDEYKPVVEKGGFFGWGVVDWPKVDGMASIDNEFLFLQITQGQLGFWCFILLSAEAAVGVFLAVRRSADARDIYFALCLGGAIAGLVLSLTTVYMGAQSYPLFFLLIGWSQSLAAPQVQTSEIAFKRVFA